MKLQLNTDNEVKKIEQKNYYFMRLRKKHDKVLFLGIIQPGYDQIIGLLC
jgi:hypothetical protein